MSTILSPLLLALLTANIFSFTTAQTFRTPTDYTFNPLAHLAGSTQPFNSLTPALSPSPPQGCNVTRAAYLIRHAAIFVNDFEYETYIEPFVAKLSNTSVTWSSIPDLAFLATWKSPIENAEVEMLTRSGKLEAMGLGVKLAQRYPALAVPKKVWTSTAERTEMSANAFVGGLAVNASDVTIVPVAEGKNESANSLTPYKSCPAYSSSAGSDQAATFQDVYSKPITARFNSQAPAFNFTSNDIYAMSLLCGYETVIRGSSPFCSLSVLSPDDWLGWEYMSDIMYHYNTGYGSPVSGAIGFPWVNATFDALMSNTSSQSNSSTKQDLYISFTHRELPPTVLVALGLFNNSAFSGANNPNTTMPLDKINFQRVWKSSDILQFLTNVGIERMTCNSFGYEQGTYYRVLVGGDPQVIGECTGGPGGSCKEESIGGWLHERKEVVGDYKSVCAVDYGNGTDLLGIYQSA